MTFKTAATSLGSGLLTAASAVHNVSIQNQIDEIDSEMDALTQQLARLEERRTDLEERMI